MKLYITLLLVNKSLIPLRLKAFPYPNKILNNTNIGSCFNIKITSIEKSSSIQSWNQLSTFIICVSGRPLPVHIKMICVWWSLSIPFFKWLPMPYSITFSYEHMVHMNRDPIIASSIGNFIINTVIYKKVIGFNIPILYIVNTWSGHRRKVK